MRSGKIVLVSAGLMLSFALLLLVFLATGCQAPFEAASFVPASVGPSGADLRHSTNSIQEGDVVSITFQYSTNYNTIQKVALDGTLNLEGAGLVSAAGKTSLQFQNELERLYREKTKEDPITVKVIATTIGVYLSGAVLRPGKIPMERPMTVLEAIMEAGGFDLNRADLTDVSVLRVKDARQLIYHLDVKKMLRGKDETPFYLKPYDIVHIPTKKFNF